jgi:RNA polymerase sigma factor (sigma-70 family)
VQDEKGRISDWIVKNFEQLRKIAQEVGSANLPANELEDIAQSAVARLLQAARRGERILDPAAFLYSTIHFLIKDGYRKRHRLVTALQSLSAHRLSETRLINWDQVARVVKALDRLPRKQSDALRLFYLEGRSSREVAQAMKVSEAYARKLVSRARSRLQRLLGSKDGRR